MLGVQLAPYLARHRAAFDFVFADAPRAATGEPEDGIPPEVRTYEWWGEPGVPYDDAWKAGFGAHPNPNPNPNPNPTPKPNPNPDPNPNSNPNPIPTQTLPQP